jgi:CheY-like chemotaxis protein
MAISTQIVIVEDDKDDREMLTELFKEVANNYEIRFFSKPSEALKFLRSTDLQPFIILCDIDLPEQSGLNFKQKIDEDPFLRVKSIPFIFLSTTADKHIVAEAFAKMTIQGFFEKKNDIDGMKSTIKVIYDYWKLSKHPNILFK